ncbi:MAG: DMT family transporter [Bacteroidales bacterium]|jgi:drug/metabolite transporter (DMT)-like permease|nr:DMT family transporter [Bacteroidales bacterium]
MSNSLAKTYILTTISIVLWGLSFVWTNDILNHNVPPFTLLFVRLATAGILLYTYARITGKLQKVTRKDALYMFLMAFFEPFIYFIGETYGMKVTGSAVLAAVIIATIPITCLFAEKILYKVPYTAFKIIGTAITIPGIVMVVMKGGDNASVDHYYGIALLFLAVAGATGYAAVVKKLSGTYNPTTITTYQFLIGALLFFPFFLGFGLDGLNSTFFSAEVLVPLFSLAILCSCVAFLFWVTSIARLGMMKANIFSALIPAVSAIGAAAMGQEEITAITVTGIAVVIAGVIIAQRN